jgi:hypothetical protein
MDDAKALRKAVAPVPEEALKARCGAMGLGASCPLGVSTDVAEPRHRQAHRGPFTL